jgi:hypothetical protein
VKAKMDNVWHNTYEINNQWLETYNEDIENLRYSMVEFNLGTYSSVLNETTSTRSAYLYNYSNISNIELLGPYIHFNNLNIVNKITSTASNLLLEATYLPVYENVNHLITKRKRKVEYFYNKRNLGMNFMGYERNDNQLIEYIVDNLHFYEVDMVPFFSYFTEDNINKGIVVPYQGISPFIDYTNANFSFIDNISIGLDSIQTQNSNTSISGVGAGVGSGGGVGVIVLPNSSVGGSR